MNIFHRPTKKRTKELLLECGLPVRDLDALDFENFLGCGDEENPAGVIGLELHGREALLRSLAVTADARRSGCGGALIAELETLAKSLGVKELYLLTETAESYFASRGYRSVERHAVAENIRQTREFSSLCPADAAVMKKSLDSTPAGRAERSGSVA